MPLISVNDIEMCPVRRDDQVRQHRPRSCWVPGYRGERIPPGDRMSCDGAGPAALVGLIWVIVAIVNVAYARRR